MNDGLTNMEFGSMNHYHSEKSLFLTLKRDIYLFVKRLFDILVALIGCLFMIPIAFVIKVCYLMNHDTEKIFFVQKRIGKDGVEFDFYKFRSMIPNADEALKELLKHNKSLADEYKENKKLSDDPRITKVGKFIRKFSIDELPQFINILKGDMSLIGNRPYLPREKKDMGDHFQDIVKTRPGITGYWQVSGRSNTSFLYRLKLEQYYSNHCNFIFDIKIFFKTFKVVLGHNGAK